MVPQAYLHCAIRLYLLPSIIVLKVHITLDLVVVPVAELLHTWSTVPLRAVELPCNGPEGTRRLLPQ